MAQDADRRVHVWTLVAEVVTVLVLVDLVLAGLFLLARLWPGSNVLTESAYGSLRIW